MAMLGARLKPELEKAAKARMSQGGKAQGHHGKKGGRGKKKPLGGTSPKGFRARASRTADVAAAAVGMDRRTYEKTQAVIASGNKKLIATMDRTGKARGVCNALLRRLPAL